MNKITRNSLSRHTVELLGARERMNLYCKAYPRGPAAVRRPRLLRDAHNWIAILGPSVNQGIVGTGGTVEAALHAFDENFLKPSWLGLAPEQCGR